VEIFPAVVNAVPAVTEKVFTFATGTAFTFATGTAFTFAPECRSPSYRNRVRIRPDSSKE
jgi:hypothetical protein